MSIEVRDFAEIQSEFMQRVTQAVYCNMSTVDRQGRPRSRILHPVWEDATGWVITWRGSHKAKHLQSNPYVSLAYIHDRERPVYADCRAEWMEDEVEKLRIWDLHKNLPAPLGFDPEPHYGSIHHPYYGLLKFIPWRIELGHLGGKSFVWRG